MINNGPAAWRDVEFRKASFSGSNGGNCVELAWRKSSFSGTNGGECVEIGQADGLFGIRDSKYADGPVLTMTDAQGRTFLARVKHDGLINRS